MFLAFAGDYNMALTLSWALFLANTVIMQGWTGRTLGRILTNTRMVNVGTNDSPGIPRTAVRSVIFGVMNLLTLSIACYVNAWWVLRKGQTIPDIWTHVEVIREP
jgi:hypothetical protein